MSNDPADENGSPLVVDGVCPTCGKPATARNRPFCSKRCADVDLQRWLAGSYAIPVGEDGTDDPETPSGDHGER